MLILSGLPGNGQLKVFTCKLLGIGVILNIEVFPVVKDLLMQRKPLFACGKQKGIEPGGLGRSREAREERAKEPKAWPAPSC